jgi:hypothetical protein
MHGLPSAKLGDYPKMFVLAIRAPDDEIHYWTSDDAWSVHLEEAEQFVEAAVAEVAVGILKRNGPLLPTIHVAPFPDGLRRNDREF